MNKIVKKLIKLELTPIALKYNEKYPIHQGWTKTTLENALEKFKYIGKYNIGILCGKSSNITVIDVDIYKNGIAHQPTLEWYNKHKALLNKTAYVLTTSNNYHFYYQYNAILPSTNLRTYGINVEIKSTGVQVVCPPSKTKYGGYVWKRPVKTRNDILKMPKQLVKIFSDLNIKKMKDNNEVGEIVSLEDVPDFLKDYTITRIRRKNEMIYYDLDKSIKSRTDPHGQVHISNNCYFSTDVITGITYHCVHNHDIKGQLRYSVFSDTDSIIDNIRECMFDNDTVDEEVAHIVARAIKDDITYCSNLKTWYSLDKNSGLIVCSELPSCLNSYYKIIKKKLRELSFRDEYHDLKKILIKVRKKLGQISYVDKIERWLKRILNNPKMDQQIDMKRNLIGFNNGVYDVDKAIFRKGTLDDRVSMTTGYDYVDTRNMEANLQINTFLNQIYPIPELKCYMMMVLGSVLQGLNNDNILPVCDGWGGNGKSVLKELLIKTLGDYATELSSSYLSRADNAGAGADAGLYDSVKRLLLFFSEPSVLEASTIKKLTGGDSIKVRTLYQKKPITIIPKFTTMIMLNKTDDLRINDTSNGTQRRIRVIPHLSRFVDRPVGKYEFLKDTFVSKKFDSWKMELFHILAEQYKQYKKVTKSNQGIMVNYPEIVGEHSHRFLNSDNPYKDFIVSRICKGADLQRDRESLSDIWKAFMDWWCYHRNEFSLVKPVKSTLKNTIESTLKVLFKARGRTYNGDKAKFCSNVLIGYRLKEVEKGIDNKCYVTDL